LNNLTRGIVDDENECVKKVYSKPDIWDLELRTTIEARKLALQRDNFYVPKVLDLDSSNLSITFEYIPNLSPIISLVSDPSNRELIFQIMSQIGEILNVIHSNLTVPGTTKPIPINIPCKSKEAFLHGDYNLMNIQFDVIRKRLVVLDWSLTPIVYPPGNWGPIFWDISWMLNSIFSSPPLIKNDFSFRSQLAKLFLQSYSNSSKIQMDNLDLSNYCKQLFLIFMKKARERQGIRYLVGVPNRYGLHRFANIIEKKGW